MQRPIKFRAWIPKADNATWMEDMKAEAGQALMFYQDDQYLQSFLRRAYNMDCGKEHESYISDGFTLLQYTGLKDKNGVEVYEGDVVKVSGMGAYTVKWFDDLTWDTGGSSHPGFYFAMVGYENDGDLDYGSGFDDCEVIGNAYENPELLTPEAEV